MSRLPQACASAEAVVVHRREGLAGDNAEMQPFFPLLQNSVTDRRRWRSHADRHDAVVFWTRQTTCGRT